MAGIVTLTRAQRVALKRVYDRVPLYRHIDGPIADAFERVPLSTVQRDPMQSAASYRQFRRTARMTFDCLMVPWAGMWLGIETDGHTHS